MANTSSRSERQQSYWRENIRLLLGLLLVWFLVSFGAGILFVHKLNTVVIGGFPLGFWFAQQGSIFVFVALIFIYAFRMQKIDQRYTVEDADRTTKDEDEQEQASTL